MQAHEIDGELRRILGDYASALEKQRQDTDRPLRQRLYEIILSQLADTDETRNTERKVFTWLALFSAIAFVVVVFSKMLAGF